MALAPFSSVDPSALAWTRTQESPATFSLHAGDAEIAVLTWAHAHGSLASARTAGASWTLKRAGFLQPTVLVREPDRAGPIARLSAHVAHHEINLGQGPGYRLRRARYLVPAWRLTTDGGQELLHIEPVREGRALRGGAVVVSGKAGPETLLLVVLSWYFVVLSWFEDEAVETLAPFEGPDPPVARGRSG